MKPTLPLLLLLSLLLFVTPAAAATELITNGNFNSGYNGWSHHSGTNGADGASAYLSLEYPGIQFGLYTPEATDSYVSAYVSQTVNIKDTSPTLSFNVKLVNYGQSGVTYPSLDIYIGGTRVKTITPQEMSTSGTTYTIDVSQYTGTKTIKFESTYYGSEYQSTPRYARFILSDISLLDIGAPPVITYAELPSDIIETGQSVTLNADITTGYPELTTIVADFGDGSPQTSTITTSKRETFSHTYQSTGLYTVTIQAANSYADTSATVGTVEVVSLDFSASAYAGQAPLTVQFISDTVGFTSYLWDFGDGTTSQETNPVHTYSSTGIYTVKLTGYTASGKSYTETKTNLINTNPQSISWDKQSYTEGDTATISWQLRSPDYTNYQYTLQILPSDSLGNPTGQSIITPQTLSGSAGTYSWDTTGVSGYYTAVIIKSGGQSPETIVSATANVISTATLTVNLAVSGTTYTNATTITLTSNGQTIATETTSSGQAQFTVPTGVYIVSATTVGYATQTATVNLVSTTSIIIDFVSGASEGTYPSGSGQAYASTFITFRCQDSGTGKYLSDVSIRAVGVEPTNPLEWMGNLFGGYWGENIMNTELSGISDMTGTITFAMFPNVRYKLEISYKDYSETRSFQASTLTGEYLISLPITQTNKPSASQVITTTVKATENKTIIATYTDQSQTTQSVEMNLYQITDGNRTLLSSSPASSNNYTQTFAPPNPSGNSYVLSITAQTGSYGEVIREYGIDFPGPRLKIGALPDAAYIVISFALLILLGAVGTYITSRMYALVVVIVALLLWWAGWLFALGPVAGIALTLCFVLAIIYYIASGGQPQ